MCLLFRDLNTEEEKVSDLKAEVFENSLILNWRWPKDSDIVYIFRGKASQSAEVEKLGEKQLKLYTKDEYKEFNGYREKIREINEYKFIVFPAKEEEEGIALINQNNGENEITVCTGKPEIVYDVVESKKLFSKLKTVELTLYMDIEVSRDTLCYVKKKGSLPLNEEDGIKFEFSTDFHAGKNEMPPFEVEKDEYVRVFLNSSKSTGSKYILKRR